MNQLALTTVPAFQFAPEKYGFSTFEPRSPIFAFGVGKYSAPAVCLMPRWLPPATPQGSCGTAVPGARQGMYLYTSSLEPGSAPRLMDRVLGSLFVLTPGCGHALQLGWRLFVPFPVQLQPIVQPWLNLCVRE